MSAGQPRLLIINMQAQIINTTLPQKDERNKLKILINVSACEGECKISFGQLRRFSWRELQLATGNFNEGNVIGQGRFRKVYRGFLSDSTKVAVKRLTDYESPDREAAFLREVHMTSVAVQLDRVLYNLLRTTSCLSINAKSQRCLLPKRFKTRRERLGLANEKTGSSRCSSRP
ncbi:hypothetical protein LguiB_027179 [Lonicera macranthoides]